MKIRRARTLSGPIERNLNALSSIPLSFAVVVIFFIVRLDVAINRAFNRQFSFMLIWNISRFCILRFYSPEMRDVISESKHIMQ